MEKKVKLELGREEEQRHGKYFEEIGNLRVGRETGKEEASERLERKVGRQFLGQGKQHLAEEVSPLVVNKDNQYEIHMLKAGIL